MSSAEGSPSEFPARAEKTYSTRKSTPDLLRHVLEETLARGQSSMSEDEWRAMQMVARTQQHMQLQLPMEHVIQLLVEALISTRFPDLASVKVRRQMCQMISGSLCEDPTSMQRMSVFSEQLCESVS